MTNFNPAPHVARRNAVLTAAQSEQAQSQEATQSASRAAWESLEALNQELSALPDPAWLRAGGQPIEARRAAARREQLQAEIQSIHAEGAALNAQHATVYQAYLQTYHGQLSALAEEYERDFQAELSRLYSDRADYLAPLAALSRELNNLISTQANAGFMNQYRALYGGAPQNAAAPAALPTPAPNRPAAPSPFETDAMAKFLPPGRPVAAAPRPAVAPSSPLDARVDHIARLAEN